MEAGNNGWGPNHDALNGGLNNNWPLGNTPWSIGYYQRQDIPTHFALAEGWTVGDMYQESVIASTNPNRVTWVSGTVQGIADGQQSLTIDNNETPGCESPGLDCYPLEWMTTPEYYEAAGVTWQIYQGMNTDVTTFGAVPNSDLDTDNFDDNPLAWFKNYQTASNKSALGTKGMSYLGLDKFYADAKAGTLPQVSFIIGPAELSEHPPYQPKDGAWLQQQVVNAVTTGKNYESTALIVSWDETGGWADHVVPRTSPKGTAEEWVNDPFENYGDVPIGPGFRLPFYIVSPWTRGGHVYTENADHNSQIMFVGMSWRPLRDRLILIRHREMACGQRV
jgi:phospholipase C